MKNKITPATHHSEFKQKLDRYAAQRQRHGNVSITLALLGLIAVVAGLFTGAFTKGWVVLGGFALFGIAVGYAAIFADPAERNFYTVFEDECMKPMLRERFADFQYNRKKGFTKNEIRDMRIMHPVRRHETRHMLSVTSRGIGVRMCHIMFVKGRTANEKQKQTREMVCFIQGQLLKLSNIGFNCDSIMIRPHGIYDTEGVRYRRTRPEMLIVGAGDEAVNDVFEMLSTVPDSVADFLTPLRCEKLMRVRRILKHYSPNTGLFLWLHDDCAEVLLTNWDNGLMPSMNVAMKESYYPNCVERTITMIDSITWLFDDEKELPPFDFELEKLA